MFFHKKKNAPFTECTKYTTLKICTLRITKDIVMIIRYTGLVLDPNNFNIFKFEAMRDIL